MKQSKKSYGLIACGLLCFLLGGIAWFLFAMILPEYERLAVPTAAILAALGGVFLIFNAIINPDSIPQPNVDVQPPKINLPPEIGVYHEHRVNYNVPRTEI
jgi:hypothetical protein